MVHAGNVGDGIVLFDQDDTFSSITYAVSSTAVTSTSNGFGGLTYSGLGSGGSLTLHTANTTGGTTDINSTPASVTTTIDGGTSANVYNLGGGAELLGNLDGPVSIHGGGGSDSIVLSDQGNSTSSVIYTVTNSTIASSPGTFGGLTYSNLSGGGLTLHTGSAGTTTNINSTATNVTTTIDGGSGTNVYNLAASTDVLGNLRGLVSINGGGTGDSINVHDNSSTGGGTVTYTVTATTVTNNSFPSFGGLTYGGVGSHAGCCHRPKNCGQHHQHGEWRHNHDQWRHQHWHRHLQPQQRHADRWPEQAARARADR